MTNLVLVLSSKEDPHVAMVAKHIPNVQFLILDPRDFPNLPMTFMYDNQDERVVIGNVDVTNVQVVWYRKPYFLEPGEMPVPDAYKDTIHENYVAFVKWMYSIFPEALWISKPWSVLSGNSKLFQLQIAREVGFRIPETLVTSDPTTAKRFVETYTKVVAKPLIPPAVFDGKSYKTMYTTRVYKETTDFSGLGKSPMIFQREVEGVDIRVTVVGNRVFPCKILKTGSIAKEIDWREHQLGEEIKYEVDENFPKALVTKCLHMTSSMGLVYGAFDFIRTSDGYFFLENNPNGQWGFVEERCGLKISMAFAEMILEAMDTSKK